jgi:hypothetical protein
MRWECGECGECVSGVRPPLLCASCGIAGGAFVVAESEPDDEGSGERRAAWTRMGMEARRPLEIAWAR